MKFSKERYLRRIMDDEFGSYFEAMCERDLDIYIGSMGGRLFHYRDHNNREVDAVAELRDGRYALFEIKLGTREIDDAAENLIRIRDIWESKGVDSCKFDAP